MECYKKEDLEKLILEQNKPYDSIGKLYGVSGNAIKKAAKRFGITLPTRRAVNDTENFSHPSQSRKMNSLVNSVDEEQFKSIIESSTSWKEISKKLGYKSKILASNVKKSIVERCEKLGMSVNIQQCESLLNKTKGDLFKNRKN